VSIVIMIACAAAIIVLVRYGLVAGLDQLAGALKWSPKARGQATGYATSSPEFVALVAAGLAGVWEAGLWNIAASNLINAVLMFAAVLRYGQFQELLNRRFLDELGFAAVGIAAPLLLMWGGLDENWIVVPVLLGVFVVYQVVDKKMNAHPEVTAEGAVGSLPMGLIFMVTAVALIAVVGIFLGDATKGVVDQMGLHPALAGWILGVMTSLPEVVTFFAVYATSQREGKDHLLEDTQEVLDNLAASNMANTGIVYPIGLAVYLVVTGM
jgi:Ca2+/Na+ antiporter